MFFRTSTSLFIFLLTTGLLYSAEIPQRSAETSLCMAAARGNLEDVKAALAGQANIHTQTNMGEQVAHFAAASGSILIMDLLFNYGANINAVTRGYENVTPLYLAIKHKHVALVEWLLNHGARIFEQDFTNATADIIDLLSKYYFAPSIELKAKHARLGKSGTHEVFVQAAAINDAATLTWLQSFAEISHNTLNRAFLIAAVRGNYQIVELLLKSDAQSSQKLNSNVIDLH